MLKPKKANDRECRGQLAAASRTLLRPKRSDRQDIAEDNFDLIARPQALRLSPNLRQNHQQGTTYVVHLSLGTEHTQPLYLSATGQLLNLGYKCILLIQI